MPTAPSASFRRRSSSNITSSLVATPTADGNGRGQSYFDRYPRRSPRTSPRADPNTNINPSPQTGNNNPSGGGIPFPKRSGEAEPLVFPSMAPMNKRGQGSYQDESDQEDDESSFDFHAMDSTPRFPHHHDFFDNSRRVSPTSPSHSHPYQHGISNSPGQGHRHNRRDHPELSFFRTSGSSSQTTQIETPPQTPIDFLMPRISVDPYPVVVAAPVPGVETMDALVDGMNDFGADDFFMGAGGMSSSRAARKKAERERFHPLYQPPLPTPPPGIQLGGGMPRKKSSKQRTRLSDPPSASSLRPDLSGARKASSSTITVNSIDEPYTHGSPTPSIKTTSSRNVAPSISEIIRAHAPPEQLVRSRPSNSRRPTTADDYSIGGGSSSNYHHQTPLREEPESEPEPLSAAEEAELLSRSSVDSITDEVRRTFQNQKASPLIQSPTDDNLFTSTLTAPVNNYRNSTVSDGAYSLGLASPTSDAMGRAKSFHSSPAEMDPGGDYSLPFTPLDLPSTRAPTQSQAIAQYLRSARLTTLLKLTRSPHASPDQPLTVSLSDLGSPTGYPVVVFLGLGGVRYVMGLYDEMAECLGIRLITIDRWGIGRTDVPRSKSARGIPEWSTVVEEVLDQLHIGVCSVMAHSAGAPYALAFANRVPERVRGDVLLLAPWVGSGAGYKWLKYVPTGILKTAQAAEWKIQAWMLGKPPTIAYEGIGYVPKTTSYAPKSTSASTSVSSPSRTPASRATLPRSHRRGEERPSTAAGPAGHPNGVGVSQIQSRPSLGGSSVFSDYDDLRDFDGRFDSMSTISAKGALKSPPQPAEQQAPPAAFKRKTSRGFLGRLRSGSLHSHSPQHNQTPSPQSTPDHTPTRGSTSALPTNGPGPGGRRLKALRSMSSLKGRSSSNSSTPSGSLSVPPKKSITPPPSLPNPIGGEFESALDWMSPSDLDRLEQMQEQQLQHTNRRAGGRRSVSTGPGGSSQASASFAAHAARSPPALSVMSSNSPGTSTVTSPSSGIAATSSYQAALGNALIVASHAESSKGTHGDLLQILNHDNLPWGFSYGNYPHKVRVWYGDRDEKIAEHAVRWMEKHMGEERCVVKVVKGADHGLMYRSGVVVEVLECVRDFWVDAEDYS